MNYLEDLLSYGLEHQDAKSIRNFVSIAFNMSGLREQLKEMYDQSSDRDKEYKTFDEVLETAMTFSCLVIQKKITEEQVWTMMNSIPEVDHNNPRLIYDKIEELIQRSERA